MKASTASQLRQMGYDDLESWAWDYGCFEVIHPIAGRSWEDPEERPIPDLEAYFENEMITQAELDYERRYHPS